MTLLSEDSSGTMKLTMNRNFNKTSLPADTYPSTVDSILIVGKAFIRNGASDLVHTVVNLSPETVVNIHPDENYDFVFEEVSVE